MCWQTCDVIDNQPLWLSLRGMVGCNLYRDGVWPIISNDGHLSYVRFKKDVRGGGALTRLRRVVKCALLATCRRSPG